VEQSNSERPGLPSTIPSPLQSVGLVAGAVLLLVSAQILFQGLGAKLFFTAEQQAQITDPDTSLFLHHPLWIVMGTAIPELVLGSALVTLALRRHMPLEVVFPLRVPGVVTLIGALLVVLGLTPLADAVYTVAARLFGSDVGVEAPAMLKRSLAGAGLAQLVGVLFGFAIVPALVEESLFRGLVTAAHRRSFWAALFAPAVLFGLMHLEPAQAAGTMILGVAFGLARLFSGSLATAIFAHAAYNGVVIVATYLDPASADSTPTTATVVGGVLVAVVGVLLLPMGRVAEPRPPAPAERSSDE